MDLPSSDSLLCAVCDLTAVSAAALFVVILDATPPDADGLTGAVAGLTRCGGGCVTVVSAAMERGAPCAAGLVARRLVLAVWSAGCGSGAVVA